MQLEILNRKSEESINVEKEPHCVFICFVLFHLQRNIYNHIRGIAFEVCSEKKAKAGYGQSKLLKDFTQIPQEKNMAKHKVGCQR